MKRIVYLLIAFLGVTLVSCEPMDDINDEIDTKIDNVQGSIDYTLVEDDYTEVLDLDFPNFSTLEDAKAYIPNLLEQKFPALGDGSAVNVGFDLYDPIRVEEYTVTAADYTEAGLDNTYFASMAEIFDFLDMKFAQAEEGDYVKLTYNIVAGEIVFSLDSEDYDLIGEELGDVYAEPAANAAQYSSFEIRSDRDSYWSEDMIIEAIGEVISENYGDVTGQLYNVTYKTYNGSSDYVSVKVKYDGNSYVKVDTGTAYELTSEDYQYIASELSEEYPDATASMAEYENFEKRESGVFWEDAMIEEALDILLSQQYPDAEVGDKFEVTYDVYDGSAKTEVMAMIKTEDGFVIDTDASISTIEQTTVFAYTNGTWSEPYMIPGNLYKEEFGQRYPNFDDTEVAAHYIGIYLESVYPYAEEGEMRAVGYKFYNGEATVTQYSNFVLTDGNWEMVPSVISTSLQFGNENGTWVPDNTIRYTLTYDDYLLIADEFADEYPEPAASMAQYQNFEQRGNNSSWKDEMILEALQYFLQEFAPNAEEGQKYLITYAIYNGTNTTGSMHLIKENGEWIPVE